MPEESQPLAPVPQPDEETASSEPPVHGRLDRFFASLQAGTIAAVASYLWMGVAAVLEGRSFWTVANLASCLFYGLKSFRGAFGWNTLAGLSVHFLLVFLLAAALGQLLSPRLPKSTSVLLGILGGTSWYYLTDGFFWHRILPAYAAYGKRPAIFGAWVLAGICVGLYSIFVQPDKETAASV